MRSVAGIFSSRADAERAAIRLAERGVPRDRINVLIPGMTVEELHDSTPTSETEGSGMGKAVGAVVGGASGAALGGLGAAAASLLIPGVGPVAAIGLAAMALFGAGGAVAGAAAGGALENEMFDGLPKDELFVYEDALRDGRSVVIVMADGEEESAEIGRDLDAMGAESIDKARERWWLGIRGEEAEAYRVEGGDFSSDELAYRRGFEYAFRPDVRGRSFEEANAALSLSDPDLVASGAFRRGYERGRIRYDTIHESGARERR